MRLRNGLLEIDRLSIGGLAGATISATGTIENLASRPGGDIDASIVAVDLAPFIEAAAARFPDNVLARELTARAAAHPGLFEDARL
ncbi:MAG: rane protein involved in colicin uptake, partial [Rhizobiaceae bacterium]|nr:rane protein involved in colicin uptake [Rhizobiaceae bacterium]